jgi:hypothetical protein
MNKSVESKYFGIDVRKIDQSYFKPKGSLMTEADLPPTWERKSKGRPVIVTALTNVKGDPEDFFRSNYRDLVACVIGNLKNAIISIDQTKD